MVDAIWGDFEWDIRKERLNIIKHRVGFKTAALAFKDPGRKIFVDAVHSEAEERFYCLGKVGKNILTVRFTYRYGKVRIIGAGYWRKGNKYYEEKEIPG